MNAYIKGHPRGKYRNSVRDPIDPHIYVPIGPVNYDLKLTVPQALELVADLTVAIQDFCKRADVDDALRRTDPGPCSKALGLSPRHQ